GNLQNNHKGLNPQNGNSPLLFQLKKFHRTAIKRYSYLLKTIRSISTANNSILYNKKGCKLIKSLQPLVYNKFPLLLKRGKSSATLF
ncbi:hypothetical protein, partial [Bacteroides ovatus]|uniref:hypothetical protein n=1 Tax=Bacteroides ovatus TaxID=28116 RepID=UPI001C409EC5